MRLPPHERLRLKREREFQSRMLASLQTNRRSAVTVVVNSPLFLWLLSIVFVTIGTIYFNVQQQCLRDGRQISDTYKRLSTEVRTRKWAIYRIVLEARSMQEVRTKLRDLPWSYSELRPRSLWELDTEMHKILYSNVAGPVREEFSVARPGDIYGAASLEPIWDGQVDPTLTDKDLKQLKEFVRAHSIQWMKEVTLGQMGFLEPWCTPARIVGLAIGTENTTIMSTLDPTYYKLDFANPSLDGIPVLDSVQRKKDLGEGQ